MWRFNLKCRKSINDLYKLHRDSFRLTDKNLQRSILRDSWCESATVDWCLSDIINLVIHMLLRNLVCGEVNVCKVGAVQNWEQNCCKNINDRFQIWKIQIKIKIIHLVVIYGGLRYLFCTCIELDGFMLANIVAMSFNHNLIDKSEIWHKLRMLKFSGKAGIDFTVIWVILVKLKNEFDQRSFLIKVEFSTK